MIRQIGPQFFTTELAATLAYYKDRLGFDCVGPWDDAPVCAIVARDEHRIHFRLVVEALPAVDDPSAFGGAIVVGTATAIRNTR